MWSRALRVPFFINSQDAINMTKRLGLEGSGGMVRVGAAHYNTLEECIN